MFCAKSGAKIVYAMEMSDIAFDMIDVLRENEMSEKVKVMKGPAQELASQLPPCDVIVSEWMGYCCIYEGMLDHVIAVRDKLLRPDGYMIPATATMQIFLLNYPQLWHEYVGFWDDVYGFKMNSLKRRAKGQAKVIIL